MTPLQDPSPGPYAQGGPQPPYQQYPPQGESSRGKGKGLLGKLMGKVKLPGGGGGSYGHARPSYGGPHPPQQGYMGQPGGYPPQPYGQPGFGGPGYGAPGPYGYPQQPQYGGYPQQTGRRKPGMGNAGMMAGGAALGMGAGLVGGALVADAIHDEQQEAYQEGYGEFEDPRSSSRLVLRANVLQRMEPMEVTLMVVISVGTSKLACQVGFLTYYYTSLGESCLFSPRV